MKGQPGELYHGVSVSRKRKLASVSNSAGYQYLRLLDFFYFQKLVEFLRNGSNTFLRMQFKYSLSVDSNSKTNEMCPFSQIDHHLLFFTNRSPEPGQNVQENMLEVSAP